MKYRGYLWTKPMDCMDLSEYRNLWTFVGKSEQYFKVKNTDISDAEKPITGRITPDAICGR